MIVPLSLLLPVDWAFNASSANKLRCVSFSSSGLFAFRGKWLETAYVISSPPFTGSAASFFKAADTQHMGMSRRNINIMV